jgi:hypothetical protein
MDVHFAVEKDEKCVPLEVVRNGVVWAVKRGDFMGPEFDCGGVP